MGTFQRRCWPLNVDPLGSIEGLHVSDSIDSQVLTQQAIKAADAYVTRHQVALVLSPGGEAACGTGVCVRVGDRFFIATAGHNLSQVATQDILIAARPQPTSERVPILARHPLADRPIPSPDVGYIELERDVAQSLGCEFLPSDRFRPHQPYCQKSFYFMKGFPSELIPQELAAQGEFALAEIGFVVDVLDPASDNLNLDPEVDIAIDYRGETRRLNSGGRIQSPHPGGLSGAGIWTFPDSISGSTVWTPDVLRLVGIERAWRPQSRTILAVQIQHWFDLISN